MNTTLSAAQRIIGTNASMQALRDYLRDVGASDCTVLITGETGTGKELVARAIHEGSRRVSKPFVSINCAAIPDALLETEFFGYERGAFTGAYASRKGKVQSAEGGTMFLDEIGELNLSGQAKLLRLIESRELQPVGALGTVEANVRLVAATNHNLERLVGDGRFRGDLFYRLNVVRIHLPPLRERKGDIPILVRYFLDEINRRDQRRVQGLDEDASAVLIGHAWPGNVRELRNLLECVLVRRAEGRIGLADLPGHFLDAVTAACPGDDSERTRLLSALEAVGWNKTEAARRLSWSRMTLYRKMARYAMTQK